MTGMQRQAVLTRMWALAVEMPTRAAFDEAFAAQFREGSCGRILRAAYSFRSIAS